MSKGLETWKLVRKHIDYISSLWLKEQRHIENVEGHSLDVIEKELKALEIMAKSLDIKEEDFFYDSKENVYYFIGSEIPKEEYDLLKEVLL